jgi:tRNA (guanine37-N1)-methyltransferase
VQRIGGAHAGDADARVGAGAARELTDRLGGEQSADDDSFAAGLLEGPQYTRPPEFQGLRVPEVLLSGNHEEAARWRKEQSKQRTQQRRPELLK